jgi:hypothetical protein
MADPQMTPDELAWSFQNAGRPPQAQQATSEAFAAQARAQEAQNAQRQAHLDRGLIEQQHAQDRQWNAAVHAQDMAASRAHHDALMGNYSVLQQIKGAFAENRADQKGFRQGFFWGLVAGAVAVAVFGGKKIW